MRYRSNSKHSEPWQRGRKGSLCAPQIRPLAQTLLEQSLQVGDKRYALHEGKAYCGQAEAEDVWHGYPVGWMEVPEPVIRQWITEGRLTRRQVKRHWENHT